MANKQVKKYRADFAGGVNVYLGVRQIKDSESPDATNCDFKGKGGIGNREGYTKIGSADTYTSGVKGMAAFHTTAKHQLIAFRTNNSNVVLSHSTDGGSWTNVTTDTFASLQMDTCQAFGYLFTGNGSDVMKHWDGTNWNTTTNGTKGYCPTYYNKRIWVIDEESKDRLNFSGQTGSSGTGAAATETFNKLGDFADATSGYITFEPGSGKEITGLRIFKDSLYVFLRDSIYKIVPHASSANTFVITQITSSVGCVAPRSICQVEEDIYFASDDGVYALGEVANYTSVRTTNKSGKIQEVFTNMTAANKAKMVGEYFNFKYHLFYSLGGTENDSCYVYDVRYGGWQDWRNMAANDAVLYTDSTNNTQLYFGHPTNAEVYKMYSGTDDAGTSIQSTWYSKSFDDELPDITKIYFDHTFIFGALNGTATVSVIFDDYQVSSTKSLSQTRPQGGFGRDPFGRQPFGDATNTVTVTNYVGLPLRIRAKDQKFAVQYKITSSGSWRLDQITTTYIPLPHEKFRSDLKL